MPTIELVINKNKHHVSCNDGEEERLQSLADKFNQKLNQLSSSLKQIDDKTLYLITALILLDETEEASVSNAEASQNPLDTKELIETISDKILSIKNALQPSE